MVGLFCNIYRERATVWAFLGVSTVCATLNFQQFINMHTAVEQILHGISFQYNHTRHQNTAKNIVDLSIEKVNATEHSHFGAQDREGQLDFEREPSKRISPNKIPQVLKLGRFRKESAYPYLSMDIWHEIVDNNETFFIRPQHFSDSLSTEHFWLSWLDNVPWPVKLVMNTNVDWSFPDNNIPITTSTLDHKNLERLYVMNPVILHPKIMPIPIGLRWQRRSTDLYGESKGETLKFLNNVSLSPEMTKSLFASPSRTETVWVRPCTGRKRFKYERTNAALKTQRGQICGILKDSAPNSTVCAKQKIPREEYFEQLRIHRFVVSSAGIGLDTHATWEALLAGCIPIVPRSPLSPMYEVLPVWQVDSWEEVTDAAVAEKSKEFLEKADTYQWDMAFATGWERELKKS